MDIGEQERVIVVEPLEIPESEEFEPEMEPDEEPVEEPVEPETEPTEPEPAG